MSSTNPAPNRTAIWFLEAMEKVSRKGLPLLVADVLIHTAEVIEPKTSKKKKKKKKTKRSGRQEEVDLSDRHPANPVSPQETADAEVDVSSDEKSVSMEEGDHPVAELLLEPKTSKKKKKKKKTKRSGRQEEVDLSDRHPANPVSPQETADAEVDVSSDEKSVSMEEGDRSVAELLPEPKTSKKKKKQGKRKSGNRNKRNPVQIHAQPAIDPSRIAKLSDSHNYLRTVKAKSKQKQRELGLVCQKIAGLQDKLRDCHAEGAHLVEKEACYARRLEKLNRVERGLDREIKSPALNTIDDSVTYYVSKKETVNFSVTGASPYLQAH
ncbi:unnamed protein product [Taenia asiatica]|uniref:Centromere protein U n=1 Tax=Taenia asiatica TaxID=60517 RepID=A0A158R9V5_TAEAS|nr:unnamed protein product [Taenia asiatica]